MNPILECFVFAIRWDLTAMVCALLLWPAFHAVWPRRLSWGAARLLAPAVVAYVALLPAVLHQPTPFNETVVGITACLLGILAWATCGRALRREKHAPLFREALAFEKAHLVFLVLACLYVPFIDSMVPMGERLRDTGILNALLTQRVFPVEEPWFAGVRIHYYTFGYYMPAAIGLFIGRDTLFIYNLIIVWIFSCYGGAGWLIFRGLGFEWAASLFGAAALALGSSLACLCQALKVLFAGGNYDWWWVSRVIDNTIDEFPVWTASLGDLHPHYLAMPLFPCLLALIAGTFNDDKKFSERAAWGYALIAALLTAWIWGANTWELPVCYTVAFGALWLCAWPLGWKRLARITVGATAALGVFATIFLMTTPKANKTWGFVQHRSTALEILLHWGLFLLPVWIYLVRRLRGRVKSDWWIAAACAVGLAFVVQSGTVLLVLSLALVVGAWWVERDEPSLPLLMALGGLGLILFCEILHLQDIFGDGMERLNTVFKFYVPAWAMMAAAAAYCALEIARDLPPRWARAALAGWAVLLAGHVTVGLHARTGGYNTLDSMDGYDFWSRLAPDDARLMRWAREQVLDGKLSGTVLEASGGAYQNYGRVMTAAGLPGYFAWEGYGGMLQTLGDDPRINHRMQTGKDIFNGVGFDGQCDRLATTLREEKVDYVVIGQIERKDFAPAGIDLLQRCLKPLHDEGSARLLSAHSTEARGAESIAVRKDGAPSPGQ